SDAQRAASSGNLSASSRNCCFSHPEVSSSDPASRNSAASSTVPGASSRAIHCSGSASAPNPSSRSSLSHSRASRISANALSSAARFALTSNASITRRPGAHVVRSRSNSRSLSNSKTSCADRDILLKTSSFLFFYFLISVFYFPALSCMARYSAASSAFAVVCTRFPFASPHIRPPAEARGPCSTSRTRSRIGCQKSPTTAIGFPAITDLFSISHTTASSTSVPVPPLHTANPSASRINSNSRSSHVFIRTSVSTHAFALRLKNSAVTPYVFPPASLAPRETLSITPPKPPLQTANPRSASNFPSARASSYSPSPSFGRELPKTVIIFSSLTRAILPIFVASLLHCFLSSLFSSNSSTIAKHNPSSATCSS